MQSYILPILNYVNDSTILLIPDFKGKLFKMCWTIPINITFFPLKICEMLIIKPSSDMDLTWIQRWKILLNLTCCLNREVLSCSAFPRGASASPRSPAPHPSNCLPWWLKLSPGTYLYLGCWYRNLIHRASLNLIEMKIKVADSPASSTPVGLSCFF